MARWRHIKQGKIPSSKPTPPPFPAPSIADRLKAFLTDTFMITMPIIYIVIYLVMGSREAFREHMGEGWLYILIPHAIIVILFWTIKGQTPGMKAYNLKLVSVKNLQKPPNIFLSTLRYLLMPFSILSIVGVAIALFQKEHQCLHDIFSLTRVVRE